MARVQITVLSDSGKELHRAEYSQGDVHHCIERLGDGDGWKWVNSHHGKRAQDRALAEVGWGFVLATRDLDAHYYMCVSCGHFWVNPGWPDECENCGSRRPFLERFETVEEAEEVERELREEAKRTTYTDDET